LISFKKGIRIKACFWRRLLDVNQESRIGELVIAGKNQEWGYARHGLRGSQLIWIPKIEKGEGNMPLPDDEDCASDASFGHPC
jgi:hypothetical protein